MMFAKMQCEMCGAEIKGPSRTIKTEGTELIVCSNCVKFGIEVHPPVKTPGKRTEKIVTSQAGTQIPVRKARDLFDQMNGELAEDYAEKIRAARMEQGLTQKDLALAMMEKELLIKKLEKGELTPEDSVRKKIEKVLSISLLENPDGDLDSDLKHTRLTTTMGDVIKIKKNKK